MDKRVDVSFTLGTLITIVVVIAGAVTLWTLRSLVLLVLTAIVIASSIEPGVIWINNRGVPRVFAVFFMYLFVFGSLFSVLYFFFPPIIADAQLFLSSVPQYLDTLNIPSISAATDATANTQSQSLLTQVLTFQSAFTSGSEGILRLIATFFGGIFSLLLVIVLSFYFAVQEKGVEDFLRLITTPKREEYVAGLWLRAKRKIGLWMQGQLLLSLIVGVLVYLGMLILGVKYALLLAVFTAMAELVPIFGSLIAGACAAAVAFSTGGVTLSLIVAGLYVIVNQFEANLIYPLVVKKVVGLPPLLVILALIAGGELAGFLGVLLSVPVAAAVQEFIADLDRVKRGGDFSA
jgi:predicted PurR-regulated permease PerM